MNVVNVIGYFSEILTTVVTFFLAFFIIKKDRKYIANVLVGLGVASIGGYTLSIFILDISATEWVIHLFLPLALVIIMLGTLFLYFGFQVLSNSVNGSIKDKMGPIFSILGNILYLDYGGSEFNGDNIHNTGCKPDLT